MKRDMFQNIVQKIIARLCHNRRTMLSLVVIGLVLSFGNATPAQTPLDEAGLQAVLKAENERIETIAKARTATIAIFIRGGQGGGSGVVITPDGYALTNFHVAQPCGNWMQCGMLDGKLYNAVIVGFDPVGDVALIKLFGRDDFPVAKMANSDKVRVGDWAFAIGNPFLLATDFKTTVTYGVVSGVNRYQYPAGTLLEYADCIQTDAAINPGNSGGPLFNAAGELIGINGRGSFEKRGRVNVGVGYAISINQIKHFMGHLRAGRIVDHATLGATVSSNHDGRVVIDEILEQSDAYRRGLRYDDEIISFAGRSISTANAMKNVLGIYPKGWRVPLAFRRGTERHETFVRLMGVHAEGELLAKIAGPRPQLPQPQPPKKEPKDNNPDKKPKLPGPIQKLFKNPAANMPAEVKKHFLARAGYANYYFNQLNRDRIWKAHQAHGSFADAKGVWRIKGQLLNKDPFELQLSDTLGICDLPIAQTQVDFTKELGSSLDPPGSNGMLVALHLWRRLLITGPKRFGQVTYWGHSPLYGAADVVDMLSAIHGGLESRVAFDRANGQLLCIETYTDEDRDPCEIHFSDYRTRGERQLPHRIEVRSGNKVFAVFKVNSLTFEAAENK